MYIFQNTSNRIQFFCKIKNFEQIVLSYYIRFYRYNNDFEQTQMNITRNMFRNKFSHDIHARKQKTKYENIYFVEKKFLLICAFKFDLESINRLVKNIVFS